MEGKFAECGPDWKFDAAEARRSHKVLTGTSEGFFLDTLMLWGITEDDDEAQRVMAEALMETAEFKPGRASCQVRLADGASAEDLMLTALSKHIH